MYDLRPSISPPAVSAREADAQCRGIATSAASTDVGQARARHVPAAGATTDGAVDRPAVRDAARELAAEAATWEAHEGLAGMLRDDVQPSLTLLRLMGQLQATVTRYVGERRAAGAPVERVLPEVKGLVREAASAEGWFDPTDALMAQVVRWTIAGYYDQPELGHVPRFY